MPKPDIHPTWYPDAKVICNGEVVMTTGATQPEIHVDVWSGNHPFFTGTQKILDTEGRVDRFMKKYGMGTKKKRCRLRQGRVQGLRVRTGHGRLDLVHTAGNSHSQLPQPRAAAG